MKKKISRIFVGTIGILIGIFILFSLDILVNKIDRQDPVKIKVKISTKDNFNQYGLPLGMELSESPFFENKDYIFYVDRLLKKIKYNKEQIQIGKDIFEKLFKVIPQELNSYIMPIPNRIIWEGDYPDETENYESFLVDLENIVPRGIKLLDLLPILKEHNEEYLFSRTEDSWTARGAYYGSSLLLDHMGLTTISLEKYNEYMYSRYRGINEDQLARIYRLDKMVMEKVKEIPYEPNYYYLMPHSKNRAIRTRKWKGHEIIENINIASKVRKGRATIIGSEYLFAVAEGEGNSEKKYKTALLLCDLSGHMLVPFLTPYYEKVYILNIIKHEYKEEEFKNIFKEYDISEVIVAQDIESIGDISKSKFFRGVLNNKNNE